MTEQAATLSMPTEEEVAAPRLKLFSGTANRPLAEEIAQYLGVPMGEVNITEFADGELYVRIGESVRGDDVYIVQPTCRPVNHHLIELMIMIDAFKRASARQVTAVIPYYGYARQDRKTAGREAITAKLIANLLTTAGADRVVALDLHAGQIQGFFDIIVDHLFSAPVIVNHLKQRDLSNIVVVSPDVGGVNRARSFAKRLGAPLAIIDKRRPEPNRAEVLHVIGDVKGMTAIMVDDMVDTAGTLCAGADLLLKEGAKDVYACATHAVLSGPAIERLQNSVLKEIVVTNTIPLAPEKRIDKIKVLSVAPLLGETINRINRGLSVSSLFD